MTRAANPCAGFCLEWFLRILVFIISFWCCLAARADIVVGVAGPLSGPYAALGQQMVLGAQTAVDAINARGGINGEMLVLSKQDDACDTMRAQAVAKTLVDMKAAVVIGHYCSYPALAAAKLYEPAGIPLIAPVASLPALTTSDLSNVIRLAPRDDRQGQFAALRILKRLPQSKVGIVNDGTPAMVALTKNFIAAYGKAPALVSQFPVDTKDFSQLIGSMKAQGIDVLYLACSATDGGRLSKQAADAGLVLKRYGPDALLADSFWEASGSAGEGTFASFARDPERNLAAKPVIETLRIDGQKADGAVLPAYAGVELYAAAAKLVGAHSGTAISNLLKSGKGFETVAGHFAFDNQGDDADNRFSWYVWSNGIYQAIVEQE